MPSNSNDPSYWDCPVPNIQNDQLSGTEVYFKWFGISFACCGLLFGILFNSFNDPDVNGICPAVQHKCTYN